MQRYGQPRHVEMYIVYFSIREQKFRIVLFLSRYRRSFDDTTQEALFMVITVEVLPFCPVLFPSWRQSDWRSGVFTGLEGLGGVYRFLVYIQ